MPRSTTTRSKPISGGIEYFLNCDSLSSGEDVKNNAAYDNTVVVGTQSSAYANGFSYLTSCTSGQLAPYLNGAKNLTFSRNTYPVPSPAGRYLLWGGSKSWYEWRALGHDVERQPVPVAAEAGALCRRVRRTQADAPPAFLAVLASTCPITGRSNTTRSPPDAGVLFPSYSILRSNYIQHTPRGGATSGPMPVTQ